jgi:hypothetical protein
MAEVKIDISAEDKAAPALNAVRENAERLSDSAKRLSSNFAMLNVSASGTNNRILEWKSMADDVVKIAESLENPLGEVLEGLRKKLHFAFMSAFVPATKEVIATQKRAFGELLESYKDLSKELDNVLSEEMKIEISVVTSEALEKIKEVGDSISFLDLKKTLALDTAKALEAIAGVKAVLAFLGKSKRLALDVSEALSGARQVRGAIDAIPDVTYKDVVIRSKTMASPVMPFGEGLEHIKRKMESLPSGGDYVIRIRPGHAPGAAVDSRSSPGPVAQGGAGLADSSITFSPTINVNGAGGDGRALARDLDLELARMWRYGRSELRKAVTS